MNKAVVDTQNDKAVRLVEYLIRLASLRAKVLRDIGDYERILWINDIPRENGCFTQAWGPAEGYDADLWIEIQNRREPPVPSIPRECREWVDKDDLRIKTDLPELLPEITIQIENPDWREGTNEPDFIQKTERIADHPELEAVWERYVEAHWLPWVDEHSVWETVRKVYSSLFAIHQELLRLGEEYELVLGIGLLTWQTQSGQAVRRHLVVANASLEFEAQLGKFTIQAHPDGANLRPELDMLDIHEQPARAEEVAKGGLASAGDDPWEKACTEGVLKALVHSISSAGEYEERLGTENIRSTSKPVVEYAPAIILRKRSTRGLSDVLTRIKLRIQSGEQIPGEFGDLAEIGEIEREDQAADDEEHTTAFDGEIFFPKPSNEEQRRIVQKMRGGTGVLVQGPPGTGKSHTIANLICHLLATGQRTLITAKTPRALQVLEELVPPELRPLCINLLGSGLEEKRSLESSVGGIRRKNDEWNEEKATSELARLEVKLRQLREEKVQTDRRLRDIRESETLRLSLPHGRYQGTAAQIAQALNQDSDCFDWFKDPISIEHVCPHPEVDLRIVLDDSRRFTEGLRTELKQVLPEAVLSPQAFHELVKQERKALDEEAVALLGAEQQTAEQLLKISDADRQAIFDSLSNFQDKRRKLLALPHVWMQNAVRDLLGGNQSLWRELSRITAATISSIETTAGIADDTNLEISDKVNAKVLFEDVCKLQEHLKGGGRLGWFVFRPRTVKERIYVLKDLKVNGKDCANLEAMSRAATALRVRVDIQKLWDSWAGRCEKVQGPYAIQLQALSGLHLALESALALDLLIEECRNALKKCPAISEPIWIDEPQVQKLIASCTLANVGQVKQNTIKEMQHMEAPLMVLAARSDAHAILRELLEAIRSRDIDAFTKKFCHMQELQKDKHSLEKLEAALEDLHRIAPIFAQDFVQTCRDPHWDARIAEIENAWHWIQAKTYVEEYLRKEDAPSLSLRSSQIQDELNQIVAEIAALRAWSFCFSRLTDSHRRHMEAWQQSIRKLGKATGKHAHHHRKDAQLHLNQCREAVPAWIMPLHRVWDTVEPAPGLFDVIIVDEASQCGFDALPLFYLAKKILIVGDDKQISPEPVGLDRGSIHRLMEEFLYDYRFQSSFDIDSSLFDHGKLRYGNRQITLREHFRCMPEIIRFSNELCYADTPLIPLRQYGPNRLAPLQHVFVPNGFREGSESKVRNCPEADAIVSKIAELCRNPNYADKTMGVVVLQGEAQGELIENALLSALGAQELEKRRVVCGNPYSFQGDERDIIFLSMVAATNERIGAFTKPADERRFNVAASRARDQMFLFHSVQRDHLSASCLRRRLLEFFEDTQPQQIAGINKDDLERRAKEDNRGIIKPPQPFDSWFEVDVALELLRKGFNVIPQYPVAGKKIDLVVEGGLSRLAVECDGDNWHGLEQYDADMERLRKLQRCGWEFFQIRESAFYFDKQGSLRRLWQLLEERGITSRWADTRTTVLEPEDSEEQEDQPEDSGHNGADSEDEDELSFSEANGHSSRRVEQISPTEISEAIFSALKKCPNNSCTEDSMTSRILKELGVRTRGRPRADFEKRVIRVLENLDRKDQIERYKSKNRRIKLPKG